ncbi:hypothetical protein ACXPWS_10535 [Mycobacterium sp. BMJ-28]
MISFVIVVVTCTEPTAGLTGSGLFVTADGKFVPEASDVGDAPSTVGASTLPDAGVSTVPDGVFDGGAPLSPDGEGSLPCDLDGSMPCDEEPSATDEDFPILLRGKGFG